MVFFLSLPGGILIYFIFISDGFLSGAAVCVAGVGIGTGPQRGVQSALFARAREAWAPRRPRGTLSGGTRPAPVTLAVGPAASFAVRGRFGRVRLSGALCCWYGPRGGVATCTGGGGGSGSLLSGSPDS